MATQTGLITAEELERMPNEDAHVELVKGGIVRMSPAGTEHGEIAYNVVAALTDYIRQTRAGRIYVAETGFILARNPDTVRAPDVAFVSAERVARCGGTGGFFEGFPDLAVEVVSPGDSFDEVEGKAMEYLEAGTPMVWVVRPRAKTVTVYRSLSRIRVLTSVDTLSGEDVLPGFEVRVATLFEVS